jgi:hypothetical protein
MNSEGDALLWLTANILVSVLAIAIAFYDGLLLSIVTWCILMLVLMVFRPN